MRRCTLGACAPGTSVAARATSAIADRPHPSNAKHVDRHVENIGTQGSTGIAGLNATAASLCSLRSLRFKCFSFVVYVAFHRVQFGTDGNHPPHGGLHRGIRAAAGRPVADQRHPGVCRRRVRNEGVRTSFGNRPPRWWIERDPAARRLPHVRPHDAGARAGHPGRHCPAAARPTACTGRHRPPPLGKNRSRRAKNQRLNQTK